MSVKCLHAKCIHYIIHNVPTVVFPFSVHVCIYLYLQYYLHAYNKTPPPPLHPVGRPIFSASGRTNLELKKYLSSVDASPGSLAMAGFRTTAQTEIKAKNEERARASKTPERTLKGTTPPRSADAGPAHRKTPVASTRQPASKQRTPERSAGAPKPKNSSIPSGTRHFLPRQSPKRESGGVQPTLRVTQTQAHKTPPSKMGTVAGPSPHKADGREGKKTTPQGSKSPPLSPQDSQVKPTGVAQQATTPTSAKSRLPQPSPSRIPAPGSGGRASKLGGK